jgi:AAA family ATP:ADP antiporter
MGFVENLLGRVVNIRPGEARALLWSFFCFFFILSAYYVLRPLRDNAGIAAGARNLPWLFTATFFVLLAAVPVYGWIIARFARHKLLPIVYQFFVANILLFWALLALNVEQLIVGRVFFVWLSVFTLFVVPLFWSLMADLFRSEQGKRLYGFVAAGGSIGALAGPTITVNLVDVIGPVHLFLIAALLLELALFSALRLEKAAADFGNSAAQTAAGKAVGGNPFNGLVTVLKSPYLGGIASWVALLSLAGTVLYLLQANVVAEATTDAGARTRIFATIDQWIGLLQILIQLVVTGRVIKAMGVGPALAFLPLVFAGGFVVLAAMPALLVVMSFQALQRTANFGLSNPAREILFTVAAREDKYKAKNVIDGVVFRGADMVSSWIFSGLQAFNLSVPAIAAVMIPVSALWAALALALGREQDRRAKIPETASLDLAPQRSSP